MARTPTQADDDATTKIECPDCNGDGSVPRTHGFDAYRGTVACDLCDGDGSITRRTVERIDRIMTDGGQPDDRTATEFIPADENGVRDEGAGVRHLRGTSDGGLEVLNEEPHDDVRNHVFVCDGCGHKEQTEDGMAHHIQTKH